LEFYSLRGVFEVDFINNAEKKILLIDDEKDITDLIEDILLKEGFKNIRKAYCGIDGITICMDEKPDVVVLDIMLPDVDGIEVCKRIREFSYCPILFLSAKNSDVDKIVGLSMGGDDYITKPFSPREIAFRIKAQIRRQKYDGLKEESKNETIKFGNITIDKSHSQVYREDIEVNLTAKEYKLLLYLAENSNKIVNKERLCEVVWGEDYLGYDNTISVHVRHLREKLEENPSKPEIIVTVIGLGYKLVKRNEQ
jgi:two-component system, OmpR family, response regulator VicR